jgi:Gpi18-like mannosyltransferase
MLKRLLLYALLLKLGYLGFAVAAAHLGYPFQGYEVYRLRGNGDLSRLLGVFHRHDSGWYEKIATEGHHRISRDDLGPNAKGWQQSYYGFLPFYPWVTGLVMRLTGLSFNIAAFLESIVFSLLMLSLFYRFCRHRFGEGPEAYQSTLLLLVFPFHFYFSVFYTEALFLFLLLGAFVCITERRWLLLGLCCSCMALTRPTGLFMTLPLALYFTESHITSGNRHALRAWLPLTAVAAGLLTFGLTAYTAIT